MSRKSRRGREVFIPTPSLTPVARTPGSSFVTFYSYPQPIDILGDRRQYHPLGPDVGAFSFSGLENGTTLRDRPQRDRFAGLRKFPSQTQAILGFNAPADTLVCVRRQRRKEVLHALRKAGRSGSKRKARRNWTSKIHC